MRTLEVKDRYDEGDYMVAELRWKTGDSTWGSLDNLLWRHLDVMIHAEPYVETRRELTCSLEGYRAARKSPWAAVQRHLEKLWSA